MRTFYSRQGEGRKLLDACPELRRRVVVTCLRVARKQVAHPVCCSTDSSAHKPRPIAERYLKKISIRIEPDSYFLCQMVAPTLSSMRIKLLRQAEV